MTIGVHGRHILPIRHAIGKYNDLSESMPLDHGLTRIHPTRLLAPGFGRPGHWLVPVARPTAKFAIPLEFGRKSRTFPLDFTGLPGGRLTQV